MFFLFVMIVFVVPAILRAQTTVSGTVVDQQTHESISGADVLIEGTGINTTTDDGGKFTISSDKNFMTIVVTRIGYQKKNVLVTDKTQPFIIQLVPVTLQLQGLDVTGRALTGDRIMNAQSIGALSYQDLNRADGLSLENSINTIPGVFMRSRTAWGGAQITIRGYYPNFSQNSNGYGSQVFLNNIPVTDATGLTILDDIDFSSLGSVEVIKGPASSEYGSFIAGTLNLQTAKPTPNQTGFEEEAIGGSYGLFRDNTTFHTANDNSAIVADYGHQTYNSFRPNSISKKDYVRFNGDFLAGTNQTISTYFSYNHSFEQLSGEIDSTDFYNKKAIDNPVYAANNSFIKIESFRLGATDDYWISNQFDNQTTVFGTGQTMGQPYAHGFNDYNRFSFGARSTFGFHERFDDISISGKTGGFFQRTNYTANGFSLNSHNPSDQENYAMNYYGFTEWNVDLPMQFTVTVGGTVSWNEFGIRNMLVSKIINDTTSITVRSFTPIFTPRVSLLKMITEDVSVYGSVSTGYTPPSLSNIVASNGSIDLSLKPERGIQYEVGTKGNVANKKLSYEIALFDMENTDKLVSQKVGAVSFTTNAGKQRNRGAEVSLSCLAVDDKEETISLMRPWLSYTYSDFKYIDFRSDNNNNAATVDFSGEDVARTPRNIFNAGLDAATNFGLYFFGSYQFVDKAYVTFNNSNLVNSYSILSAKLGYQKQIGNHFSLDLSAGGDNLLGSTYYTFIFVGPNFAGLAQPKDGGTGDGYILPGPYKATFYGGVTLSYAL